MKIEVAIHAGEMSGSKAISACLSFQIGMSAYAGNPDVNLHFADLQNLDKLIEMLTQARAGFETTKVAKWPSATTMGGFG